MNEIKNVKNDQVNVKNAKASSSAILILLAMVFSLVTGCLSGVKDAREEFIPNLSVRTEPQLNVSIVNKFGATSELELCEAIFSKTADMQKPFKRVKLYKNNSFSLTEFAAGETFYIGAFIDLDGNLEATYGVDPIGGAYEELGLRLGKSPEENFSERDRESNFKVVIKSGEPTNVEIKMLRPITGRYPQANTLGTTTMPEFSWSETKGIVKYIINVYNDETANPYWRAASYSTKIRYSLISTYKDMTLINPVQLPASAKHKWSLAGYDENDVLWAYAPGTSFMP